MLTSFRTRLLAASSGLKSSIPFRFVVCDWECVGIGRSSNAPTERREDGLVPFIKVLRTCILLILKDKCGQKMIPWGQGTKRRTGRRSAFRVAGGSRANSDGHKVQLGRAESEINSHVQLIQQTYRRRLPSHHRRNPITVFGETSGRQSHAHHLADDACLS